MQSVDLSIIIVSWNALEVLKECLARIAASRDTLAKEILLVDNGSEDGTAVYIKEHYPQVALIESPVNLGFIRANNLAYKNARGKYILMLNSDAFIGADTLQETVDFMEKTPECGALGARLIGRDGVLQPSARYFPTPLRLFLRDLGLDGKCAWLKPVDDLAMDHGTVRECDWVVGCFLLARKVVIDSLDFFLREDYFLYNDDNDLCLRIKRAGWKVYFYPTDVIHLGGESTKKMGHDRLSNQVEKYQIESEFIYFRKNYHLGAVVVDYLLKLLFDAVEMIKTVVLRKKRRTVRELLGHMALTSKILFKTRFGARSIH